MDIRSEADGKKLPGGWTAKPHLGKLFIDDATGFVSAATPTDEIVDAAPVTIWTPGATVVGSVAAGTLTIVRSGIYRVDCNMSSVLGGNASIITAKIFLDGAVVGATAALGGSFSQIVLMAGTAAVMTIPNFGGLLSLVKGQTLSVAVTGTVGTVTIKKFQLSAVQLTDSTPPTP